MHWHWERAFLKRFPSTCLRTWCGCRFRCLRVSLQKSWLLENRQETSNSTSQSADQLHTVSLIWVTNCHCCRWHQEGVGAFSCKMMKWQARVPLRLLCARHNVWLVLAVVEVCCSTQFLIFLPLSELLQLRQAAGKLMAIQSAFDLIKTTN